MAMQTVTQAAASVDPIDRLIARGAKARQLVNLFPQRANWLAEHQDDTFRICYHDDGGNVVVEQVNAVRLLTRAEELGWSPDLEEGSGMDGWLYQQAPYSLYRGVHYYASAYEEDELLPLCLPPQAIRAAAARTKRRAAKMRREAQALKRKRDALKAREDEAALRVAKRRTLERWTEDELERAKKAGAPISRATAKKLAREALDRFCKGIEERMTALHAGQKIGESA